MSVIETINLSKSYGKNRGIIDVNLKVEEGEIFGFIGPNGAGKSTFIRTILNFIFPTSGSGSILGKDIEKRSDEIKKEIGYVPSEVKYYGNSYVREIIAYAKTFKDNIEDEKTKYLINELDIDVNKRMNELSLGNKKKIAVLQALMGNPKLLILDEPTSGLDPLIQKKLFDILIEHRKNGNTVFLSSHNLIEVENLCDRVAIIKEGQIVDTLELQDTLSSFGRIIEVEGNIPVSYIEEISKRILLKEENKFKFVYEGNIDEFIKSMARYDLENIAIRKENIEDTFMKYYEDGRDK